MVKIGHLFLVLGYLNTTKEGEAKLQLKRAWMGAAKSGKPSKHKLKKNIPKEQSLTNYTAIVVKTEIPEDRVYLIVC